MTEPDGSMRLELLGLITDGLPFQIDTQQEHPVLLGRIADGSPITLEALHQVGRNSRYAVNQEPHETEALAPRCAYVSAHLPGAKDRCFREASVELPDLAEWAGAEGLDEKPGRSWEMSAGQVEDRTVALPFGNLVLRQGWLPLGDRFRERGFRRFVTFDAAMRNQAPLEQWQSEVIGPLRHLMTFACDRVNEVSRLSVLRGRDRIEVVYEKAALAVPARPAHPTEFPLSAASLGSGLEDVVARWFHMSADIGPVLGLFLGQRYRPGTFVENHFLNTVTAAEAYHRARHSNEVLDPSEFQARKGGGSRGSSGAIQGLAYGRA